MKRFMICAGMMLAACAAALGAGIFFGFLLAKLLGWK